MWPQKIINNTFTRIPILFLWVSLLLYPLFPLFSRYHILASDPFFLSVHLVVQREHGREAVHFNQSAYPPCGFWVRRFPDRIMYHEHDDGVFFISCCMIVDKKEKNPSCLKSVQPMLILIMNISLDSSARRFSLVTSIRPWRGSIIYKYQLFLSRPRVLQRDEAGCQKRVISSPADGFFTRRIVNPFSVYLRSNIKIEMLILHEKLVKGLVRLWVVLLQSK